MLFSQGAADRQTAGHGGRRGPVQPARRGDGPQHPTVHQGGVPERTIRASRSSSPTASCTPSHTTSGRPTGPVRRDRRRIDALSLAPYKLEAYRKKSAIRTSRNTSGRRAGKSPWSASSRLGFLKRLESSIEAFRLSLKRALTFEETYKDYCWTGRSFRRKTSRRRFGSWPG